MASAVDNSPSSQYFESLRSYVLSPLTAAQQTVDRERCEIRAEIRSFERFVERVEAIECEQPGWGSADGIGGSPARRLEDVREAYRETVMEVDHYGDVYDNTLRADIEAEFSSELAAALCPETEVPFTEYTRSFVLAAAERSIEQRGEVVNRLGKEARSLGVARDEVGELVKGLDGACIPQWHADSFLNRLNDLAAGRQATIRRCRAPGFTDGHRLCEYLYEDQPWTYPVLTALARLRQTVVVPTR